MICLDLDRHQRLRDYMPKQTKSLTYNRRLHAIKYIKVTVAVDENIETLMRQEWSPQSVVDYFAKHKQLFLQRETLYQLIYANKTVGENWQAIAAGHILMKIVLIVRDGEL